MSPAEVASLLARLSQQTQATLQLDPATLYETGRDFGGLISTRPAGLILPRDAGELAGILRFAQEHSLPCTLRGKGYSQSGQSLSSGGLCLDTSRLDKIDPPDVPSRTIRAQAGATWRQIIARTLPEGLLPQVLPLNLDMTLGGLLSAGGIGANSFRYGPVSGHVVALEAVTGDGEQKCASWQENTALFESALAGLGRYAAITAATLVLRPARPQVRLLSLLYADVEPWLEAQQELIKGERCHYLEGFFWSGAKALQSGPRGRQFATHWMYGLQLGVEFDPQDPPQDAQFLTKLKPWRVLGSVDFERGSFPLRYQPRFEAMVHSESWRQAHPWLEAFLEEATLQTLLPAILERLPASLGDGHRAMFVNTASAPPLFALPKGEHALCFAVLPTGIPPPLLHEALTALKEVDRLIAESGGKRYLSGWLGPMDDARWRTHYGQRYDLWGERKRQFDPAGIFTSSLFNTTDGEAKRHQSPNLPG